MSNYTISFKSLRSGYLYTVSIGGGSGNAIPLKGAAQPFTTQEDDDDDMFTPIRTQSGYLRIVDDGLDANGNRWNWKDLLPTTDIDRPVTLTHVENGQTVVDWIGFMQAQNFGGTLYGNPQEREFPVQCVLSVTEGTDINYQQTELKNFAYLLKQIVDSIPQSQRPQNFIIQGGANAQTWLLTRIDWQNFTSVDNDNTQTARFSMYRCIEDMCSFWGWTARTCGDTLYLTCAADEDSQSWLTLTYQQLTTMAGGVAAGTTGGSYIQTTISGSEFASVANYDFVQRGYNKAEVTVDPNTADDYIIDPFDSEMEAAMNSAPFEEGYYTHFNDKYVHYTKDVLDENRFYLECRAFDTYASFNVMGVNNEGQSEITDIGNVVSIKKTYDGTTFAYFYSKYEHCFHNGFFRIFGEVYRNGEIFSGSNPLFALAHTWARLGIGKDRAHAKWWDGKEWQDSQVMFQLQLASQFEEMLSYFPSASTAAQSYHTNIINVDNAVGRVFFEILGSNSNSDAMPDIGGTKRFDILNFKIKFDKNDAVTKRVLARSYNWVGYDLFDIQPLNRPNRYIYKASNQNRVKNVYNADVIYGSDDAMNPSYGVLINPSDNTYLTRLTYGSTQKHPEQHLADVVTNYWGRSRRRFSVELRTDVIGDVTPQHDVECDGTHTHPIAISHEWRDDKTILTLLDYEATNS